MDADLKDLIEALLQLNPKDRLGADIGDENNGLQALKSHKFFNGIDFNNIHKRTVPVPEDLRATLEMIQKANEIPMKIDEIDSDEDNSQPSLHKAQSHALSRTEVKPKKEIDKQFSAQNSMKKEKDEKLRISQGRNSNLSQSKYAESVLKESIVEK